MATIKGNGSKHSHEFTLEVTETGTSVANNTSSVSFTFSIYKSSYSWSQIGRISYNVNINGTEYEGTIPSYSAGSTLKIKTGTQTIKHNSDGSKTIDISFSVTDNSGESYTCGNASASDSMKLTNIPRYATVSQSLRSKTSSSIAINWSSDSVIDYIWYSTNNGSNWNGINVSDGTSGNYTISNLSSNTSYSIKTKVRRKDSQLTTDSSTLSVKTYAKTTPTISLSSKTIDTITVSSSCNVSVSSTKYRIKKSSGSYGSYQTSNKFTGLQPNTSYIVEVNKTASESGESGTATLSVTTYDIAKISSLSDFEHGNNVSIGITNPGNISNLNLIITASGTQILSRTVSAGNNTIIFSDEELDNLYKKYGSSSSLTATFTLSGSGYTHSSTCTVTFKGDQKTAYLKTSNVWKRGKANIKINGIWRKAVVWEKINGTWRRCI